MDDYRNSPTTKFCADLFPAHRCPSAIKFKIRLECVNKLFSKLRMFWSKLCKSTWNCAWNLAFPVFISPIVWNMCENLPYELVYFKELHNEQECYWPAIYRAGAAVVSTITSDIYREKQWFSPVFSWSVLFLRSFFFFVLVFKFSFYVLTTLRHPLSFPQGKRS